MLRKQAERIASDCIQALNPSKWDGTGFIPHDFDDEHRYPYSLSDHDVLFIYFEFDEDHELGWCHVCQIIDKLSYTTTAILSGYGVDSIQNLTDTILDICKDNGF